MNVCRNELLDLYLAKVVFVQMAERDLGRTELVQLAIHYLNTADPQKRLSEPVVAIFSTNISAKTSFDLAAARNVFSIMEKYVINLLDCPWKREFRKITMYSGFYKTRIEPSLKDAWKLLVVVGYEKVGMCLELKFLPDASKLQDMAFEFFLASVECLIYKDVFQKVSSLGFKLRDIHRCRRSVSGNSDVLFKALSDFCVGEKQQVEGCETKASSQVQDYLSKLSKNQQSEKNSEYEDKVGSGVQIGGVQSESSQRHMGGIPKVVQRPEHENEGNDCGTRTASIEAMLRDLTPEMISDINIRRQILKKLSTTGPSARSQDEALHGSLPMDQVPHESTAASYTRPHTEPLFIPKQLKVVGPYASEIRPFTEPLVNLKQQKIESKVVPSVQPYALPVPKEKFAVASDQRSRTEPLFIPKQEYVRSKMSSKSNEAILPQWQCAHCFRVNNTALDAEKCATCRNPRKEA